MAACISKSSEPGTYLSAYMSFPLILTSTRDVLIAISRLEIKLINPMSNATVMQKEVYTVIQRHLKKMLSELNVLN